MRVKVHKNDDGSETKGREGEGGCVLFITIQDKNVKINISPRKPP